MAAFFGFVTEAGIVHLAQHNYKAAPYTPLDNLFEPFWAGSARLLPRWISPNAISLFGGVCASLSTLCCVVAGWYASPALYICSGLLILIYMTADAVDGKHARLTQQSTPMGALVDHGIDAFVAFTTGVAICVTVDPSLSSVRIMAAFCAFHTIWFLAQWAELEAGSLDTTGITEGELAAAAVLALPGVVALDVYSWRLPIPGALGGPVPARVLVEWAVFAWSAGSAVAQLATVFLRQRVSHRMPLLHIALHDVVAVLLASTPLYSRSSLLVFLVVGMDACMLMTKIRFTASTHSPWQVVHPELLPFLVLATLQLIGLEVHGLALLGLLAWQALTFLLVWYDSISKICIALDIPFLAPVPKKSTE